MESLVAQGFLKPFLIHFHLKQENETLQCFNYIWNHLGKVLILLLFITVGKTFCNIFILNILKQPWPRAFLAGIMLAQMGEFSFVLVEN